MEFKDYYKTLGLDKTASEDDIKKAYRKKVRKYHPDVSKEPDADKKTKEVNEAYGVLGDPDKRAAYDQMGSSYQPGQKFRPTPESEPGFDFFGAGNDNDFFADLFANVGRRRGGGASQARGQDIHASIAIDLSDAYHGATLAITLHVPQIDAQGCTLSQQRTLNVNIPKGITQGQQLRLSGQASPAAAMRRPATCTWKYTSSPIRVTWWKGAT